MNHNQQNILSCEVSKLTRMQIKLIGMTIGGHVIRNDIHTGHLVFLFPLHAPILEPYFDLSFREAKSVGYLYAPSPS